MNIQYSFWWVRWFDGNLEYKSSLKHSEYWGQIILDVGPQLFFSAERPEPGWLWRRRGICRWWLRKGISLKYYNVSTVQTTPPGVIKFVLKVPHGILDLLGTLRSCARKEQSLLIDLFIAFDTNRFFPSFVRNMLWVTIYYKYYAIFRLKLPLEHHPEQPQCRKLFKLLRQS